MSKRQEIRERRRQQEQTQRLVIIVGIVLIAAAIVGWVILGQQPVTGVVEITPVARPQASFNHMGDPNAPVKIEEFSDYQCPYCKKFYTETEAQLVEAYIATGKVYFTYRSMGNWVSKNIGGGSDESEKAAQAAYCAADQNKFWEMHDMLFANVKGEDAGSFTDRTLPVFAAKLGLDTAAFNSCFAGGKYRTQAEQDYVDGVKAGVTGTPSFVISYVANGQTVSKLIDGAQPFTTFQQEIDAALAAAGQ